MSEVPTPNPFSRTPLGVHPITLAFRDPALERDFRAAWAATMLLPVRLGALVLLGVSVVGILTEHRWLPSPSARTTFAHLQLMLGATYVSFLALTFWRRAMARLRDVLVTFFVVASQLSIPMTRALPPHSVDPTAAYVLLMCAVCILFGLGFVRNTLFGAAFTITFFFTVPHAAANAGHLETDIQIFCECLGVCMIGSFLAERRDRRLFLDERLLARERARTEALLKQEVGHQVAERSRELAKILQRVDASFVPGRLSIGDRFDGRYRVVRVLGGGAMGAVYEVERRTDGQRLALKVVTGQVSGAQSARFAREAEIGARLRHSNLVSIVDVGISSGTPFLVMELADGGSLEEKREQFGDARWARPILVEIAEGLAALHEASVVHRDMKPGNVLFSSGASGEPIAKISDFGISRFGAFETDSAVDPTAMTMNLTPSASPSALTATGALIGTPFYMAPEAAHRGSKVGSAADVFAFGILACEMLTRRAPFSVPAVFVAMSDEPLPEPRLDDVTSDLRGTLRACLAADASARPSMKQVRDALAASDRRVA